MKVIYSFIFFGIFIGDISAQSAITGTILDESSKAPLIGASVYLPDFEKGSITNELGQFTIDIEKTVSTRVQISYVGYETLELEIEANRKYTTHFLQANTAIDEITILATKEEEQIGRINISTKALLRSVQFGSEADIMKSLQLLPSITFGSEGSSNIYVRGGSADENLILLDDVPIFNINHLYGLISTIDPQIIESSEVFTGALPARYGGKLSSVLGMRSAGGFSDKWSGQFGLGLLSSKAYLKGPLINKNINIELSARRSLLHLISSVFSDEKVNKYGFSDYYGKVQIKLGQKGRLAFFYYQSDDWNKSPLQADTLDTQNSNELTWANQLGGVSFHYQMKNIYTKSTLYQSKYNFGLFGNTIDNEREFFKSSQYDSDIAVIGYKQDIIWTHDSQRINIGWDISKRAFNPGSIHTIKKQEGESIDSTSSDISEEDAALRAFVEYEYEYGKFKFLPGVNFVAHLNDQTNRYHIEPRVRLSYQYDTKTLFEASYGRMNQLYNIFNTTTVGLPTDSFVPTNVGLTSPSVDIVSLGIKKDINKYLKFQTEIYYKKSNGLNAVRPGSTTLIYGDNWQEGVVSDGSGKSYGIEMMLTKHTGRLTGWLSYTLSKTTRQFEEINNGESFDFQFSRPHDLKLTTSYQLSDRWRLSVNWLYTTGQATTLPIGILPSHLSSNPDLGKLASAGVEEFFSIPVFGLQRNENNTFLIYGKHNGERFPAYHRMDVSIEKSWGSKRIRQSFQFSIYNVYNRKNTYYITSGYEGDYPDPFQKDNPKGNYSSVSLFPLLPSISYQIKF